MLKYASELNAATPSAPQTSPMTIRDFESAAFKSACSSGVNVNPQGLRPLVLYFSSTMRWLFRKKNGASYLILAIVPDLAKR